MVGWPLIGNTLYCNMAGVYRCVDIDECVEQSHDCDDPSRAECINNQGGFTCVCKETFSGDGRNCVLVSSFLGSF